MRSKTCALQVHARQVLSKTCALSAECLAKLVHWKCMHSQKGKCTDSRWTWPADPGLPLLQQKTPTSFLPVHARPCGLIRRTCHCSTCTDGAAETRTATRTQAVAVAAGAGPWACSGRMADLCVAPADSRACKRLPRCCYVGLDIARHGLTEVMFRRQRRILACFKRALPQPPPPPPLAPGTNSPALCLRLG
jgi:hypothetical protein